MNLRVQGLKFRVLSFEFRVRDFLEKQILISISQVPLKSHFSSLTTKY
jgi:hypothetical protein